MLAFSPGKTALVALVLMTSFAQAQENADLRPAWAAEKALPANSSLLYSTRDPSFLGPDFSTRIFGQRANQLKQDYEDRNRDYDMRASYGLNNQIDEQNHNQSMKEIGRNVIFAARSSQGQVFARNFREAERDGDVSKPVQIVGGAAALGMGTPVDLKLGQDAKATWHGDALRKHGQLDLRASDLYASLEMDGKSDASEHYKFTVNKPLALNLSSQVVYGGTSNTVNASLSRPIIDNVSGTVGTTMPAGNSPTGTPTQETVGLSYGLRF